MPLLVKAENYENQALGISVQFTDTFERVRAPSREVPFALKRRGGTYPTFNIVAEAGQFNDFGKGVGTAIAESYHSVGLQDASVKEVSEEEIAGKSWPVVTLAFSVRGKEFVAKVDVISFTDRHFFLTFVSEKGSNDETLRRELLNGVTFAQGLSAVAESPNHSSRWKLLGLIIGLILALGVLVVAYRWKR